MKQDFWPEDTDSDFYLPFEATLEEILDKAIEKWGLESSDFSRLLIRAECIHTTCLNYDLYDSSDYTNFIAVSLMP